VLPSAVQERKPGVGIGVETPVVFAQQITIKALTTLIKP
jgi:hypothetical protein